VQSAASNERYAFEQACVLQLGARVVDPEIATPSAAFAPAALGALPAGRFVSCELFRSKAGGEASVCVLPVAAGAMDAAGFDADGLAPAECEGAASGFAD